MGDSHAILSALAPIVVLLALGSVVTVASRAVRLSPVVGYLLLGLVLNATGIAAIADSDTVAVLAELGVVLLLFDIGLHFSMRRLREQSRNVFGFGPLQVLFSTIGVSLAALAFGLSPLAAVLIGATLSLSSTAVVARLIAERHQQNCPLGLTATAILIFQDVAAIFLLIVGNALGETGGAAAVLPAALVALGKAAAAFVLALMLARFVVRPVFDLVARSRNEEVFTAMALLVALGAGWLTGMVGLSLTLGAFLGGMIIAETPYRAIIQSEIKPFRGLLLSFFLISVGLSLDPAVLARAWPVVLGIAVLLIAVKSATNMAASLVFRWSVPGSAQLGFLLAQGSEFAFVVLSLPAVRALIGEGNASVLVAAVAITLAVTPNVAAMGRRLGGRLGRASRQPAAELQPRALEGPVLIVGMGKIGRTLADGLAEFAIDCTGVERDQRRLAEAVADGYRAVFGDAGDPRLWPSIVGEQTRVVALTAPDWEVLDDIEPAAQQRYPNVVRFVVVHDHERIALADPLSLRPVIDRSVPPGLDLAAAVLRELDVDDDAIGSWMRETQRRSLAEHPASGIAR